MKIQTIRIGENKISLSQTSKGIWYCNDITLYCRDFFDGIQLMGGAVDAVTELLAQKNSGSDNIGDAENKS